MKNLVRRSAAPGVFRFPSLGPALAFTAGTLSLVGSERPEPHIDAASVQRVMTTLSADEMAGRAPFTPAIDEAADFIRDEFARIQSLDDSDRNILVLVRTRHQAFFQGLANQLPGDWRHGGIHLSGPTPAGECGAAPLLLFGSRLEVLQPLH